MSNPTLNTFQMGIEKISHAQNQCIQSGTQLLGTVITPAIHKAGQSSQSLS